MSFVHQRPDWPRFSWDSETIEIGLSNVYGKRQARFKETLLLEPTRRSLLTLDTLSLDVVGSSAIEGEVLDPREVRSSIARRLDLDTAGLPKPGRKVDGIVDMMLDATRRFDQPLTKERLVGWHRSLFPMGHFASSRFSVGAYRTDASGPMQVVSGPMGREIVHFEAPQADRLEDEMEEFVRWFEASAPLDPVIKAGVAHLWFLTIHPFDDGNGRMARALTDMLMARSDGTEQRFYSLSTRIESERTEYYRQLEFAQRGELDCTGWLEWFLGCLERAIEDASQTLDTVIWRARLWERIRLVPLNERQLRVVNRMMDGFEGHLTTSKYAKLAKCSQDSALRDVRGLLDSGILVKNPGAGRSTSYRLVEPEPES